MTSTPPAIDPLPISGGELFLRCAVVLIGVVLGWILAVFTGLMMNWIAVDC